MSRVVWYFAEKGEAHGPLAWDGLQAAVQEGRLTKKGWVWSPGIDDWVPSPIVPWLIHAAASPSLSSSAGARTAPGAEHLVTSPPPVKQEGGWRWKWPSVNSPIARFGLARAAISRRAAAAFLDLLFASLVGAVFAVIVRAFLNEREIEDTATRNIITGTAWMICLVLYQIIFESINGTTFGKSLMTCRLVDSKGEAPFATRIVARVLLRFFQLLWVGGILRNWIRLASAEDWAVGNVDTTVTIALLVSIVIFAVPLFIGERRPLHDVFAGCWLVRTSDPPQKPPR